MKQAALLVIDMQNDFLNSINIEPSKGQVIEKTSCLLEKCRGLRIPIIHVRISASDDRVMPHWKQQEKLCCIPGTMGHAFPEKLNPLHSEILIEKTFFSAFSNPKLFPLLKSLKIKTLIIAGAYLHSCVRATAIDAYQHGYKVLIAEDAVISNDLLHSTITHHYLNDRIASFIPVDQILELEPIGITQSKVKCPILSPTWQFSSIQERIELLENFATVIEENKVQIVRQIVSEISKPLKYAEAEVARAIAVIRSTYDHMNDLKDVLHPDGYMVRFRPLGSVAVITPWNNPLAISFGKIASALFYGNTVVWKASPLATLTAKMLMELLYKKNPNLSELVHLMCGDSKTAKLLMENPLIKGVTISGSTKAGCAAQVICSRRRIPLQAELGGNNPVVVWGDSDLKMAGHLVAEAAFGFAGQRCTAARRVIVDANCYEEFLLQVTKATRELIWGDPFDRKCDVGPLITEEKCENLKQLLIRSRDDITFTCIPHQMLPVWDLMNHKSKYFPPTILACDNQDAEIVQEESFGPLLIVQKAMNWAHAITLCNGVKQGLAASLFSTSKERQQQFIDQVDAGMLHINSSTTDINPFAPFGGWKSSMIGPPERGSIDREFYTKIQTIQKMD